MNKKEYLHLVDRVTPKEDKMTNAVNAFLIGGTLGFIGEGIKLLLVNIAHLTIKDAIGWVLLIYIFLAALFTALGFFDKLAMKFQCGVLVPITGFAHSVTSSAMDYKRDGLITGIGANILKLAGCVLLYGLVAAFLLAIVKVIIYA